MSKRIGGVLLAASLALLSWSCEGASSGIKVPAEGSAVAEPAQPAVGEWQATPAVMSASAGTGESANYRMTFVLGAAVPPTVGENYSLNVGVDR